MSWGTANNIVTKNDFHTSGLAAGYAYMATPPDTWSGNNECITIGEAKAYICCYYPALTGNSDSQTLAYQKLQRTYAHYLRYGSSCANACSGTYQYYWSTCATLDTSGNCYLYTQCNCEPSTVAALGFYLDSSGNCWENTNPL